MHPDLLDFTLDGLESLAFEYDNLFEKIRTHLLRTHLQRGGAGSYLWTPDTEIRQFPRVHLSIRGPFWGLSGEVCA